MSESQPGPENTAERVALWRALHVAVDPPPHVLDDEVGLRLLDPPADWRARPDMEPAFTAGFRASIVARARYVEDVLADSVAAGVGQFVVLGAGLDSVAQRRTDLAPPLHVFEVDQPGPQTWKRARLHELGYGVPDHLHLVPVDFEADDDWWPRLVGSGFEPHRPAVMAATGLVQYLTREATEELLSRAARLAPGSTVLVSFLLPMEMLDEDDKPGLKVSSAGAESSGTPFVGLYSPDDMLRMACAAGFASAEHLSGRTVSDRYLAGRDDGLRASSGEDFLVART